MNASVKYYSCDFETTTDINDCRVWAWGASEIGNHENFIYGNSMQNFLEWCDQDNKVIYYQNLKFDGEFIAYQLLKDGFKFRSTAMLDDEQFGAKRVSLKDREFTAIVSDDGKYYYMEVCFWVKGKKKRYIKIYDGLKKIPFSVKRMAKTFKLDIKKGEIDYDKYRPVGHVLDEEEVEYLKNDVQIPSQSLHVQLSSGLDKMTIGSDAMAFYKNLMGNKFRQYFPLLDEAEEQFVRKSYKGGFCWVNPKYQGKEVGKGFSYDDNSLYSSRMYYCEMPVGRGIYGVGKYNADRIYNLYIQHFKCCFKLKDGHIPTIQLKNSRFFKENEYITETTEVVEMTLTNIDLELFFEHYHVYEVEYIDYYKYRGCKKLFNEYIDYWNNIKMNSVGGKRELSKLMLNNLYGKFATSGKVRSKYIYLDENDVVRYKLAEETTRETVYIPVGTFITAYGRDLCIRTAQACYNNKPISDIDYESEYDIAYCDTDSVHCVGVGIPDIEIHSKKLGAWKHEHNFIKAKFVRQKTYLERVVCHEGMFDEDDLDDMTEYQRNLYHTELLYDDIKACGMPQNLKTKLAEQDPFPLFEVGLELNGKLMPKHVKGGIVLVETTFKIN